MYTIFRGKYGIVWHYKTPQQNIKSRFYGIVARIELCKLMGYASSLSAINLGNQGFTQNVHENVHETSEF